MNSLDSAPAAGVLARLLEEAEEADHGLHSAIASGRYSIDEMLADEGADFRGLYRRQIDNYLAVSSEMGRFLYMTARSRRASRIVEFGTSFGISTLYLAAALRDSGGGELVTTELEPAKAERARVNLEKAGLDDLVSIRVGDARETLREPTGPVDMVLLDGAYAFYVDVLTLLEPALAPGCPVVADNATVEYLEHVRSRPEAYSSLMLPFHTEKWNHLAVYTRSQG